MAHSEKKKALGLMFRKELAPNAGMIFVYNKEEILTFWMKNTLIPLSIAFVTKEKKIIAIYDMKPHDRTHIASPQKALYAIEANKGWFEQNRISPGASVAFEKR